MEIKIRDCRPDDANDVCNLIGESLAAEFIPLGLNIMKYVHFFRLNGFVNLLLSRFDREFFKVIVAECNSRIVGTLTGYGFDKRTWFYGFAATHPEYRGMGIYRKLMQAHFDYAVRRKISRMICDIGTEKGAPLHTWTDTFKAKIFACSSLYRLDPAMFYKERPDLSFERCNQLPYPVSFEPLHYSRKSLNRGGVYCLCHGMIPPLTFHTLQDKRGEFVARLITQYPLRSIKVDMVSQNASENLLSILRSFVIKISSRTNKPAVIYLPQSDTKLNQAAKELSLTYWLDCYHLEIDLSKKEGKDEKR